MMNLKKMKARQERDHAERVGKFLHKKETCMFNCGKTGNLSGGSTYQLESHIREAALKIDPQVDNKSRLTMLGLAHMARRGFCTSRVSHDKIIRPD